MKPGKAILAGSVITGLAFATTTRYSQSINSNLMELVGLMRNILPIVGLGLFVLAGIIYAIGQFFDVQTRVKAQSWALSMIVGGIIGILIGLAAPFIVDFLLSFSPA